MRGTNRLQCRQGQQEYCSQVFSCRHDCFHAVWTFLTGSTKEGEDTSFLSSLSSRFDSVFIGRRKRSARSTSSFRYAPTFIFISLLSPEAILPSPKTVLPAPFLELPAPEYKKAMHTFMYIALQLRKIYSNILPLRNTKNELLLQDSTFFNKSMRLKL